MSIYDWFEDSLGIPRYEPEVLDNFYALVEEKYPEKLDEVDEALEVFGINKKAFEKYEKDEIALLDARRTSLFQILAMIAKVAQKELEPILLLTPDKADTYSRISHLAKELFQGFEIFEENDQERFLLFQKEKEKKDKIRDLEEIKEREVDERIAQADLEKAVELLKAQRERTRHWITSYKPRLIILRENTAVLQSWKKLLAKATKREILTIFDLCECTSTRQLLDNSPVNQALWDIKKGAKQSIALHMSKGILDDFPIDPFPLFYVTQNGRLRDSLGLFTW